MLIQKVFLISQIGHDSSLWILFILSVFSIAISLERFFVLRTWKVAAAKVSTEVLEAVESGQLNWIQNLDKKFSDIHPDPGLRLVATYLEKKSHLVESVFHSFILSKKKVLESKLSFLASVGSNAPFIGLLGTVFGVMDAFYALGVENTSTAPIVMMGISKALLATAVGLMTALPAILFYNFFKKQVKGIIENMETIKTGYALYIQSLDSKQAHQPQKPLL